MAFPDRRRSPTWGLAFGLSLLLHLLLALGFTWLPRPTDSPRYAGTDPSQTGNGAFFLSGPIQIEDPYLTGTDASENFVVELKKPVTPAAPQGQPIQEQNPSSPLAGSPSSPAQNPAPGGNGKGSAGTTTFFGLPAPARKIVYVLDGSSSMSRNGAFDAARNHLWAGVQSLPEKTQFQVILYNSSARFLLPAYPGWMTASEQSRQHVYQALAQLFAEGSTVHATALPLALSLEPDVIFFLSDGDGLTPQYLDTVSQKNRHGTIIHVIELHTSAGGFANPQLARFARDNGGQYRVFQKTEP